MATTTLAWLRRTAEKFYSAQFSREIFADRGIYFENAAGGNSAAIVSHENDGSGTFSFTGTNMTAFTINYTFTKLANGVAIRIIGGSLVASSGTPATAATGAGALPLRLRPSVNTYKYIPCSINGTNTAILIIFAADGTVTLSSGTAFSTVANALLTTDVQIISATN